MSVNERHSSLLCAFRLVSFTLFVSSHSLCPLLPSVPHSLRRSVPSGAAPPGMEWEAKSRERDRTPPLTSRLSPSHFAPWAGLRPMRRYGRREEAGVVVPRVPLLPAPSGRSRSAGEVNEGQRNRVSRDRSGKRPRDSGGLERRA